jgi:hypothetical protein
LEDIKGGIGKAEKFAKKEAIAAEKFVGKEIKAAEKYAEKKAIPYIEKKAEEAEKYLAEKIAKEEEMRKAAEKEIAEAAKEDIKKFGEGVSEGIKKTSKAAGEGVGEGARMGIEEYIKQTKENLGMPEAKRTIKQYAEVPRQILEEEKKYVGFGNQSTDEYKAELEQAEREGQIYADEQEYLNALRGVRLDEKWQELREEVDRFEHREEKTGRNKEPKSLLGAFEIMFGEGLREVGELPEEPERMREEIAEQAIEAPKERKQKKGRELIIKVPAGDVEIESEEAEE